MAGLTGHAGNISGGITPTTVYRLPAQAQRVADHVATSAEHLLP